MYLKIKIFQKLKKGEIKMKNIKKILLAGVLTTAVAGGALMPTVMSYAKKGQIVNGKKSKDKYASGKRHSYEKC